MKSVKAQPKSSKTPIIELVKRPKSAKAASQNWKVLAATAKPQTSKRFPVGKGKNLEKFDKNKSLPPKATPSVEKRYVGFNAIPESDLNRFQMIDYDSRGKIRTPLPSNIAPHITSPTTAIGLDCEFVDIGSVTEEFSLARISVINEYGYQLYHAFVKPKVKVLNYLTQYSGVRPEDLENGVELEDVQTAVYKIIEGKILVGHSIDHDLSVLKMSHPRNKIRDTSIFFKKIFRKSPPLKLLAKQLLGVEIQTGEHLPTEDAQAALKVYLKYRTTWEALRKAKTYQLPRNFKIDNQPATSNKT